MLTDLVDFFSELQKIVKRVGLAARVAEDGGGMEHCHHKYTVFLEPDTVLLGDFYIGLYDPAGGDPAQAHDYLWSDKADLVAQPFDTHLLLLGLGVAVFGRAALNDICYVNILVAVKVNGGEHFVEQLTRSAHERLALQILVFSGAFADKHYLRLGVAHPDDYVRSCLAQLAFSAILAG